MPSCSCAFAPGTHYKFGSTSMAMLMKLCEISVQAYMCLKWKSCSCTGPKARWAKRCEECEGHPTSLFLH